MTPATTEHARARGRGHDRSMATPVRGAGAALARRDLDNPRAVSELVAAFYRRVLTDPTLAPVFTHVARVDLDEHLPLIEAFWRKMLLGQRSYARNMVARHAAVHARFALAQRHFDRWLALFTETVDERFSGPHAERARRLAGTIATNLRDYLHGPERRACTPVQSRPLAAPGGGHQ